MELSKIYEAEKVEKKIYNFWLKSGFFNPDKLPKAKNKKKKGKNFCIVLPPPNITGSLHMGHALNATCQDILIRWRRLQGYKTLWLPGTDHAGIATQNVVEKELKKQGLNRFDLGREKFREKVWDWKTKYGNIILEQFKKLGCSADWSRTRFTLDKNYAKAVDAAFLHYYKKGWIYKGKRPINWCLRCRTSLSDLEIEYKEEKGKLWYIKYPLAKNYKSKIQNHKQIQNTKYEIRNTITVATTRPETMLGDTAIAVNPKDKKYKYLVGEKAILPLINREIPIVADNSIDPKFGTGAVKVTPAHNLTDYQVGLRHNLEIIQVINEEGKITNNKKYQELKILEAREKIIEDLQNLNLIEKTEDYLHQIPVCYRCGTVIELIPSEQWFLKMSEPAKKAEKAVKSKQVSFHPKRWEKVYFDWLKKIEDWCISRQLWWGHRLPVWQCQTSAKEFIASIKQPKKCPFCRKCKMKQSADVLDTWFSAALWPFATLGWPEKTKDLKTFYPTQTLSTAGEIINLWVTRMIFSGMEFMKKPPFKDVYIHATVLTREGKRMSKSLGTGIDPSLLIEKYGADATRLGIIWQVMGGQDIRFVEDNIIMGKKFCNKLWNAARFVLMNKPAQIKADLGSFRSQRGFKQIKNLTAADRKILKSLGQTTKDVDKNLKNFQFGRAVRILYNFFWHDFCDVYIEKSKLQKDKKNTQKILLYVLLASLNLLHPFIPFITEEIYQKIAKRPDKSMMIENWPE